MKRAEELLRGTRFEPELGRVQDELAPGAADDHNLLILRCSEILNSKQSLEEVEKRLLELVIHHLRAERGVVFELDDQKRFRPKVQVNVESQCIADALEYSDNILRRAVEDDYLWSGNALSDERFAHYDSIAAFKIKSFICVALRCRGRIVGSIYVDNRSLENSFTASHVSFLRTLANQAGIAIDNARLYDRLRAENQELRQEIKLSIGPRTIVGDDVKFRRVLEIVERVAESEATVLITGESGTGKELIAHAIHERSTRLGHPLVTLNCAAIPENLLESELFGYVRGAFSGAEGTRTGKFEAADGGTLFLDEIGDMSFALQAKILRVLQEGKFEPLGSNQIREVDVRIVAATNRDLAQMVRDGHFRGDLYYRLNVIVVDLPPLRERRSDIPKLARHFLARCATSNTRAAEFSPEAMQLLVAHDWPGNIRELEHFVMRLVLLLPHEVVQAEDVRPILAGKSPVVRPAASAAPAAVGAEVCRLDDLERQAILAALEHFQGSRTAAAQALGISVRKLQYKLKEYQQPERGPA